MQNEAPPKFIQDTEVRSLSCWCEILGAIIAKPRCVACVAVNGFNQRREHSWINIYKWVQWWKLRIILRLDCCIDCASCPLPFSNILFISRVHNKVWPAVPSPAALGYSPEQRRPQLGHGRRQRRGAGVAGVRLQAALRLSGLRRRRPSHGPITRSEVNTADCVLEDGTEAKYHCSEGASCRF